ncbi:hypothetical protein Tco_0626465 [Tanacetum coccineum]|uniref:Uncharacterized protein n=1 Tax=Tanacetum coccineum TaxID=301880 RepID=A0ABQ4WJU4_9ASTR
MESSPLMNAMAVENVVENESHFSLEVVDQDLSSLAMFTKHLMGRGGGVGSNSGVGEGKEEFMGGIGGGSFAKRSMVAKDGLGGDGFVVDGGRSPSTSSKDGEDGGVENKSSMGSRLIVTGEIVVEWLLEKLVGLPMCSPMVERMVDREEKRLVLFSLGIVKKGGNNQPADKGLPSMTSNEGTGAKYQAGEDIDEDTQADTKVQSPLPNTDKPESYPVQDTNESTSDSSPDLKNFDNMLPLAERQLVKFLKKVSRVLFSRITKTQWAQHEEVVVSYVDLKAAIEAMNSLDKNSIARGDLLNALNGVTKALNAIQDVVRKIVKDTSDIKSMMTEGQQMLGENVTQADTEEPPSHTKGEHAAMEEEPTNAVPITTVKPTEIPTLEVQPITTIISTSQPEPYVPQREGKAIVTDDQPEDQRKLVPTSKEIQAHLNKEEKIKKAVEEGKLFEITKTEVIMVVQEEAEKIGLDPNKIISAKACETFKKAQDAKHQVLKREHSQKSKRAIELRMKRVEQYMWIMSKRLKPEPITNVKIYPNIKPAVLTVYRV